MISYLSHMISKQGHMISEVDHMITVAMETDLIPGRPRTLEMLSEKSVDIFSNPSTTAQNDFFWPSIDLLAVNKGE